MLKEVPSLTDTLTFSIKIVMASTFLSTQSLRTTQRDISSRRTLTCLSMLFLALSKDTQVLTHLLLYFGRLNSVTLQTVLKL